MRGLMRNRFLIGTAAAVLFSAVATAQIVPGGGGGGPVPAPPPTGGGIKPGVPVDGGKVETDLDKEFKAFLVGRWRVPLQAPSGWTSISDVTYSPDGTFSGAVVNTSPYGTASTPVRGTWKLIAVDQSNFNLTLSYKTPINPDASDLLTMIDQNTLYSAALKETVTRVQ